MADVLIQDPNLSEPVVAIQANSGWHAVLQHAFGDLTDGCSHHHGSTTCSMPTGLKIMQSCGTSLPSTLIHPK